ncbi:hypothetical protein MKW92_048639 [Papaver armeniacum]|nr:hypothetical protein MKW92_048639 [Papaver armeniacum]
MDILPPPPPSLPPCIQMVTEAISSLKTESGLSQHAIAKFIEEKYYVGRLPQSYKKTLLKELNELAKSGKLVKGKRSFKLPEKVEKISAEIEKKKKKKKVKVDQESKTEGEEEMIGIRKYLEKYERLRQLMIPSLSKEELIQKEKANLEEWKKVAEISSVDLSLVESLENLMQVQHEQLDLKETTLAKIRSLEDSYNKKLWAMQLSERDDQEEKGLYERRNEIIKSLPKFWSTAFMSDDALKRRLNKEDKKIIKFLRSVDVEGRPDVTPECIITLNFDKNPYFKNSSLTKNFKISEKGIFDVRCTPIIWKNGKGNTAGLEEKSSKQSHTDMPKSFFTWFEDPTEKFNDEVANLIACDLWCYAPDYYVNATPNV